MLSYLHCRWRILSPIFTFFHFELMRIILLTLLVLLLPLESSYAASAELYSGSVTVDSQQASDRKQALPQALLQVLQKISGIRQITEYPLTDQLMLDDVLGGAASIVVSFHYLNEEFVGADGSSVSRLRLVARFSEPDVNELVKTLRLPLWRPERQPTHIWVVVDNGLDRRIMPLEFGYARFAMDQAAADRGLPLAWPEPDADGNYPVDEQLLWGGYTEDLSELGANAVMVAAARREGTDWSVRFNLAYGSQNWTWRNSDVELQRVLTDSIQQAADLVAGANSIAAEDQGKMSHELTVTGIRSSDDYARCMTYLQNLSVVEGVSVIFARSGQVRFKLELNALPQYLEEAIATGGAFDFVPSESVYQFRP